MKKMLLLAGAATLFAVSSAKAQETILVQDEAVVEYTTTDCGTVYDTPWNTNWFIEVGAGFNMPFVENPTGADRHFTANYGVGFGKWFSPYFGWRAEFSGGSIHWNNWHHPATTMASAKSVSGNLDIMWDMFNSIGGVNDKRVFSIVPFIGVGGTFNWKYKNLTTNEEWIPKHDCLYPSSGEKIKKNEWLLPVSAGIQFRFRLCKYVDFFAQARASFYSDSYNNTVVAHPVDVNLSALGGFTFNLGGRSFKGINPCDYMQQVADLNTQVNDLRAELATTAQALAEAQELLENFPCPEAEVVEVAPDYAPLLGTVRFSIGSAAIRDMEKVNVYNLAQWMKGNDAKVVITGYADKGTGTSNFNMQLSKKRADAVCNMLVKQYGINPNRLIVKADGSNVQPYEINNWNRIVIFTVGE